MRAWALLPWPSIAEFYPRVPFETKHLYPVSYYLDAPSGTVRLCYHKGDISFDFCCDERHGERGNEDCWDSIDTFEECCSAGQRELLEHSDPWPADRIFHNAHLAVQLDRDPAWFSFAFRASSVCPDFTGPESATKGREAMRGMPDLVFDEVARGIRRDLEKEPRNLWTLVREACGMSVVLALTIYSGALQERVGLRPDLEVLMDILERMRFVDALFDVTGYPLLPPNEVLEIWEGWMSVALDFSLPLQRLAELTLHRAQGAYYATEDFYFTRLRPRLLEGCGAVCDMSQHVEGAPSFWLPTYTAEIDCPGITGNRVISQSSRLWPPLRGMPQVFKEDFAAGGVSFLARYELPRRQTEEEVAGNSTRCRMWTEDSVEELRRLVRSVGRKPLRWPRFGDFVAYDSEELNSTARFVASVKDAIPLLGPAFGGHWLVLGSLSPWIEAILLEYKVASRVSTLEYSNLSACPDRHPKIATLLPEDFNGAYLSEERFDGFVQWSSIEHSGLGMYGDEVNPWGDRQSLAQLWCRGKDGAFFFFGPGPEGPGGSVWGREAHNENRSGRHSGSLFEEKLYWNAGRDYGRQMLGRLMLNWKLVRPANSTWHFHVFQRIAKIRTLEYKRNVN
ncbi:unnamed protein product [Effrenium voratum]|uniref:Uncharacterized protein n=1 Tax=Effrenium voratum TaxID=2562239 RepID=A0AA36I7K1_9DINO|nr:unnamed protein product [Effrenium voratum]